MRSLLAGFLVLAVALFVGCQGMGKKRDYTPKQARFFLEEADARAVAITLPKSESRITIGPKPVFTEGDIADVQLVQVDLGKCVLFQFTTAATRDLYRVSGSNQGRRLVLFIDNVPYGARRMEAPIMNGAMMMFIEIPDADLPTLVDNLKKTSAEIQRALSRP